MCLVKARDRTKILAALDRNEVPESALTCAHKHTYTHRGSGAALIKWGQWAASRPDLFPADFCDALATLQVSSYMLCVFVCAFVYCFLWPTSLYCFHVVVSVVTLTTDCVCVAT